jgi:hypothetical protein
VIEIFTTPDGSTLSYERRGSGPLIAYVEQPEAFRAALTGFLP